MQVHSKETNVKGKTKCKINIFLPIHKRPLKYQNTYIQIHETNINKDRNTFPFQSDS